MKIRSWWWEIVCVAVYLSLAGVQLFKTPIVGLADNGDFPKVLGRFDVCDSHDYYRYVVYKYRMDPVCRWDSGITSSEAALAGIIKQFAVWNQDYQISIRAAGKAHLIVVVLALAVLLWSLHDSAPVFRFGLAPFIIVIFSDVAYVSYCNSFYTDAAAMVFLLLTISLACAAILRPRLWIAIAFGIAAVGFITAKSQHAVMGPLLAALAVWFAVRGSGWEKRLWWGSAISALCATFAMMSLTTVEYRTYPLYNLIFFRLAKQSPRPAEALAELGLPSEYLPLVGTHSYSKESPASDPGWEKEFFSRTSYSKLAAYYFKHPRTAYGQLWEALSVDAPGIRWPPLGNFLEKDGFPPGALSNHFALWSDLRTWFLRMFPLHVIFLYLLAAGGCAWCLFRPAVATEWPLYPVCLMLVIGGAIEFLGSALLDCLETGRHLFLFHVITELLIAFVIAALLNRAATVREWLARSPCHVPSTTTT